MGRFRGRGREYWPYWGFALIGIALVVWEGYTFHNKTSGKVVMATVVDCRVDSVKGTDETCTGSWPGRAHGTIDGVDTSDIGHTVKVRVHHGTAYARTRLVAPVVFFFVGIAFAGAWVYAAWRNAGRGRVDVTSPP